MSADPSTVALMNVFIEGLDRLRIERGWSQADLAHAMGVNESYISNMLSGRRNLTLRFLAHALAALDATVEDVL